MYKEVSMTARKGLSLGIISTFLYLISPQILAKNYLNIEVADEILALGEEYKISFIEGGSSHQTHTVDKKRIRFMPENDRVFYEFTLFIEKGEKTWHAENVKKG